MVALRLSRRGTKDRPFYKIVAVDSRDRRDGRFIEQIGTYDPMQEGVNYEIDLEKTERWIGHGAQPSATVASIIKKARNGQAPREKKAPEPKAEIKEEAPAPEEPKAEAPAAESATEEAPAAESATEEAPAAEAAEEAPAAEATEETPAAEEKKDGE
jgi:small subunit ribosomal protein S16